MVIGIYITAFPFNFHQTSPKSLPQLRLMCLRRFVKITIRTLRPVAAGVADDRMDVDTAFPLRFTMLKKKLSPVRTTKTRKKHANFHEFHETRASLLGTIWCACTCLCGSRNEGISPSNTVYHLSNEVKRKQAAPISNWVWVWAVDVFFQMDFACA